MAQNEMKAEPALPERVRSMEGLGVAGSTSKCNTFSKKGGEPEILAAPPTGKKG